MFAVKAQKVPAHRVGPTVHEDAAPITLSEPFPTGMALLAVFQTLCTLVFLNDVIRDFASGLTSLYHIIPEVAATLGLAIGVVFEVHWALQQLRIQREMKRRLDVAGDALNDIMSDYFRQWSLTSAEQDVARFTIKGYSIAEIAAMRQTADGTIKTQLNAIYRKAGVQGRGQLVSVLIEDLMNTALLR